MLSQPQKWQKTWIPNGAKHDVLQAGQLLNASLGFRTFGVLVSVICSILMSNIFTSLFFKRDGRRLATSLPSIHVDNLSTRMCAHFSLCEIRATTLARQKWLKSRHFMDSYSSALRRCEQASCPRLKNG